jgi:hypothetical protein
VGSNKAIRGQVETVQQKQVKEAEGRAATVRPSGQPPEGGIESRASPGDHGPIARVTSGIFESEGGRSISGIFLEH